MKKNWIKILAACVFVGCLIFIIFYFVNRAKAERDYEELRRKKQEAALSATPTPTKAPKPTPTPTEVPATPVPGITSTPTSTPTPTLSPTPTEAVILAEYQPLYDINPDLAGWIKIEGTVIDYPVMHKPGEVAQNGKDFYYLYRDFYGNLNTGEHKPGSIFIEGRCSVFPERSDNLMVYGHNMTAGTMFAGLHKFRDENFYREHKTFRFDTLYSEDTYEIICVFITQIGEQYPDKFKFYNYVDFANKATFNYFIENVKAMQLYETGVKPEYGDELVTLITCTERAIPNGRLVVIARKVKTEE